MASRIELPADFRQLAFEWDDGNAVKCQRHGLSRAEIEIAMRARTAIIRPDHRHSIVEPRFIVVARTEVGRPAFVVFTLRIRGGTTKIRVISARYIHADEVARHEEDFSNFRKR